MASWLQSKIESKIQKAQTARQRQAAVSTSATQSGSTSTPTVTETPKVTSTPKAQPSVAQPTVTSQTVSNPTQPVDLTKINLFKPQETVKTIQSANLLTQSNKIDSPTITSELAKMYDTLPDSMRKPVDDAIENNAKKILYSLWVNKLRSTKAWEAANMFSNKLLIWWAREAIDIWQWYINKIYNNWLLPWKRNTIMNMMLPWYWLYRDYLNNKLENTNIWQQTKQVRDAALKAVFDWTERWDKKLRNLEWYKYATEKQDEWSDKWKGIRDAIDEWRWDIVATNVWETAWQMLPSLIMAFVTKDPKTAAWWIFATVFWSSYKRSLLEVNNNPEFANLTPDQKDNLATSMAVVEAWIETLWDVVELAPFMKGKSFSIANMFWIKNALLRAVVEWQWASVIEWWEEVLTEILQNAFKRAYGWSDRATAEELWQIFSDTYFIMQFLWLVWWTKWWIETHRRNTAEKLLAHEAEDFDDFEEFLESAHRWWVEDDELIADAWATSKWLTNEERVAIKKDTADIQKQENKARELYEEKQNVESQLTQLRLTPTENEAQIKQLETRLQEIDNSINNIDTKITEYMELYWKQKEELPAQQSTPQQQWWENLSEQTMWVIIPTRESEDITIVPKNFQQKSLPRKPQALINLANKIVNTSDVKSNSFLSQYDSSSLKSLRNIMVQIEQWWWISSFNAYKARNVIDKIDAAMQYISNVQSSVSAPTDEEIANMAFDDLWEKYEWYYNSIWMSKDNAARIWTIEHWDPEVSQHLIWLTNSEIKKMSKDLTKKEVMEINEAFAKASSYLWIDFNLVVWKNKFWISFTNDMLFDDEWLRWKATQLLDAMAVMVTNKNWIEETQSTVWHELSHIVDFAYKDVSWHYILANNKWSVLAKWDSYKWTKEAKEKWYSQSDKVSKYRRRPTEVWARFNQQYIAYQDYLKWNTEMYDKMANSPMYNEDGTVNDYSKFWDNDTFLSLLSEYQDIYNNKIYSYKSAEWNENFYAVMEKLNWFRSSRQIIEDDTYNMTDKEFLENISERKPEATDELKNKILNMRDMYQQLKDMVDWLKWTISNEIKKEYEVALSFMQSNLDLITSLWEEYLNMERNTKEQQKQFDEWVNNISDNWPELISEVKNNQQDWEIVDDAMKEEIEENKEPDTTWPLDVAVAKTVNKVINSANKVINKDVKEKPVNKQKAAKEKMKSIRDVWQWIKDVFTPALSRLYSISPRLAWAVHVYEASVWLKTLWYKRLSENFVKELDKLRKKNPEAYKKLSLALFDWWMDESIDIKQSLKDAWLDEKLFEPVVSALNQIATEYQSAWLDITINDKYFPRKVKDYWLLLDYLSRKSGTNIKDTRWTILKQIDDINNDPNLSDWEKERQVHNLLINNFTKPSERSNNAKERKLVLSERLLTDEERNQWYVNDITDFYEDPIVSLSNYIDDMVKKTELKKMLWWLTNDKTAISEEFDDSIAKILLDMEARWELTPEKAEEAKKVIKAIVNARATGKWAQRIKNLTYSMTIANWLSAAQQLEDLSKTLLRWPSWLKNIVKSVVGKANIGMDDTWIDDIFAELEWGKNITDLLFKLSWFDAVDSLGKKSFLNTARDSCVKQANSDKRSIILKTRLIQMYWEEMWNSIFESYKSGELRDKNKQLKLDVMVDLMYQLGNTQPIYRSAMPTAYLNNPKIRVVYCLWSFTLKQVDWVIQWTKEVYNNQRLLWRSKEIASAAATWRCIWALSVVSIISALVQEFINFGKWDEDDLMFKKWREEWFGAFLKQFWINSLSWLLKIFNISKYDQYIFDREWLDAVFINKITPAWLNIPWDIIQVLVWKDKVSEIWKYMPLFLKPLYYQFKNRDMLPDYKLWWGWTSVKPKFWKNWWWWTAVKFGKY